MIDITRPVTAENIFESADLNTTAVELVQVLKDLCLGSVTHDVVDAAVVALVHGWNDQLDTADRLINSIDEYVELSRWFYYRLNILTKL
jgi:hypothetical protein